MEVRILKQDGGLGKKIYKCDIPADMYALREKLKKNLIGIGQWENISGKYVSFLTKGNTNLIIDKELLEFILEWIDKH